MEKWDYTPVGTLQYIKWNKKAIVDDSWELTAEPLAELVGEIAECEFEVIADAHNASGSGYMGEVCPTGVCPVVTSAVSTVF
jgi:hypothetical protein